VDFESKVIEGFAQVCAAASANLGAHALTCVLSTAVRGRTKPVDPSLQDSCTANHQLASLSWQICSHCNPVTAYCPHGGLV
jgi:hypothetical protein